MNPTNDNELFLRVKDGDEQAFKDLFEKYYSPMCLFARQLLNDYELAEETVQDMFVKVWEKRTLLTIDTSVKHYFFRSIRNQCLNRIQHEKIKLRYAHEMTVRAQQEADPEAYFVEPDLLSRIEKSINSLPPRRREIFRLSREKGMKYKEIADTLHISVKTVEAQMGLALKFLREELRDYDPSFVTLLLIPEKSFSGNKG
jgi:RNA polymerase sigma-70 factor (ECF subfamily)